MTETPEQAEMILIGLFIWLIILFFIYMIKCPKDAKTKAIEKAREEEKSRREREQALTTLKLYTNPNHQQARCYKALIASINKCQLN